MRIVWWILGAVLIGIAAGLATGLLRRQPVRSVQKTAEPRAAYAGGYAAPTPSVDRTAARHTAATLEEPADRASDG
ncbi:hypothetical protein [Flindersiella endophytica]